VKYIQEFISDQSTKPWSLCSFFSLYFCKHDSWNLSINKYATLIWNSLWWKHFQVLWQWWLLLQARLLRGTTFVHETCGAYKTVEELWDGEIWAICYVSSIEWMERGVGVRHRVWVRLLRNSE